MLYLTQIIIDILLLSLDFQDQKFHRFRNFTGSEISKVQKFHRFRNFTGSEILQVQKFHRFRNFTGSEISRVQKFHAFRNFIGSEISQVQKLFTIYCMNIYFKVYFEDNISKFYKVLFLQDMIQYIYIYIYSLHWNTILKSI